MPTRFPQRVSCSVVCYCNDPAQVARTLASVVADGIDIALYLVDNSPQDTFASLAQKFGATYIHLPHNPGFGAGHNVAIRAAQAKRTDYHLVLNPDIVFGDQVVPVLVNYLEQHPDIGLIMPKILYPDGRLQRLCKLLPGPVDLLMRRFCAGWYRQSGRLARYELHESGYDKVMDVPALSGCFMLMRAAVLRETDGFDERFFMYLEDVDLSRRIGRISRTVYCPLVSVVHEYGKGSYKNMKLLLYHVRSAILYFNKWGWFVDAEREAINQSALQKIQSTS